MNIECEYNKTFNRNIYALDGVGGSGKSHSLIKLSEILKNEGYDVVVAKISGLGDSNRVNFLKRVLTSREEIRKLGNQTEKQLDDHKRQKLFRLATRYQTKSFLENLNSSNNNTYYLLDRTPLMTLAFCLSEDSNNPYLDEIQDEALKLTELLKIKKIFLFDVDPVISISRQLARSTIGCDNQDLLINNILDIISPPNDIRKKIISNTKQIIKENPDILPKPISLWDYDDYNVTINQSSGFRKALEIAKQKIGINYEIINTNQPIDSIVSVMRSNLI